MFGVFKITCTRSENWTVRRDEYPNISRKLDNMIIESDQGAISVFLYFPNCIHYELYPISSDDLHTFSYVDKLKLLRIYIVFFKLYM